ncbi:MAG: hypothetical protein RIF33_18660 [Cyclobacteriaceae bacterium]
MDTIDIALYGAYILTIVAAVAAVVLPLIQSLGDPASLAKSGLGLLALVVVFGIGYAMAGSEVLPSYVEFGVDAGLSKFIGGSLTMMYILTIGAIGGIVFTELSKAVK